MEIAKVMRSTVSLDVKGAIGRGPRSEGGPLRLKQGLYEAVGPALTVSLVTLTAAAALPTS